VGAASGKHKGWVRASYKKKPKAKERKKRKHLRAQPKKKKTQFWNGRRWAVGLDPRGLTNPVKVGKGQRGCRGRKRPNCLQRGGMCKVPARREATSRMGSPAIRNQTGQAGIGRFRKRKNRETQKKGEDIGCTGRTKKVTRRVWAERSV